MWILIRALKHGIVLTILSTFVIASGGLVVWPAEPTLTTYPATTWEYTKLVIWTGLALVGLACYIVDEL